MKSFFQTKREISTLFLFVRNAMCGKLQCENVLTSVIFGIKPSTIQTHIAGTTCWGVDFLLGSDVPDPGMVNEGTKCGENKVMEKREPYHSEDTDLCVFIRYSITSISKTLFLVICKSHLLYYGLTKPLTVNPTERMNAIALNRLARFHFAGLFKLRVQEHRCAKL